MIVLDCEQGSFEWLEARIGIPTGSRATSLLTEKRRDYAVAAARRYRNELIAEWLLDASLDGGNSLWMERGTALEKEARSYYEIVRDAELEDVGFILRADKRFGGSPDALVRSESGELLGGLEVKNPSAIHHVSYLLDEQPAKHFGQCQAYMYLTDTPWWDLLIYSPALPRIIRRIYRDEDYIGALDLALERFLMDLDEAKQRLLDKGYRPVAKVRAA